MKTPGRNYDTQISVKSRPDTFTIFRMRNYIGILGQTYDFGVFCWHLKPLLIAINPEIPIETYKYAWLIHAQSIQNVGNDLTIEFSPGIYGIHKLDIKDWHY